MVQIEKKANADLHFFRFVFASMFLLLTLLTAVMANGQGTSAGSAASMKTFNNLNANGVILDGYDPVAFFTDNKPVKGGASIQYKYDGAVYNFASQEHLNLFKSNPEKYKPQFGGWCAYAVSLGRVAPIDVSTFSVTDGRLFLQHNQRAVNGWNKDVPGNIGKADKYWPGVVDKKGKQITTDEEKGFFNNTDADGVILQGYDVVAYFTQMKPVKGDAKFFARYNGAIYWFSSEQNANMFKDHPAMFAPQYGGFCGYAMSINKVKAADPMIFQVTDGKLILQFSREAQDRFNIDTEASITKADGYWPAQVKANTTK